jgi:thiol-disulfide isomerase/thioredoxin
MKQIFTLFIAFFAATSLFAQQAEVTKDANGTKIIKGFMTQKDLSADADFAWYAENQKGFNPDANAVNAFTQAKDSVHFLVFGGTWCGDTKNLLPKFFALTDAAAFPQDRITMLGVDRSKKTLHHLTEAFNVTRVPTIIVLKNGKEIGRVVEYGRMGMIDKELGEIVSGKK